MLDWTPEPGEPDLCNYDSVKQKHIFYLQSTLIFLKHNFYLNRYKSPTISKLS